jgi:dTDP-4-dehydrorhamnose 3,5-epimerase
MGQSLVFSSTGVAGAFLVSSVLREDDRGHFSRSWCLREFAEAGIDFVPVQANAGFSLRKGTLRGMHFQTTPALEAKLVRCTRGALFDVVIDVRPESPTRYKWYGVTLHADGNQLLYVPKGCAHGYQTLEHCTDVYYMTSEYFTPNSVRGVRYDDPAFKVEWPLPATAISEQDQNWPLVGEGNLL